MSKAGVGIVRPAIPFCPAREEIIKICIEHLIKRKSLCRRDNLSESVASVKALIRSSLLFLFAGLTVNSQLLKS